MDNYLGEIRMFGGSFAPVDWALCNGQLLQISGNEALFTLIGTTYGGDGVTTFGLPNLQSRSPVGYGQGPGLTNYVQGQVNGVESVTLAQNQLGNHTHAATLTGATGSVTATATLNCASSGGGGATPGGALLGVSGSSAQVYANAGSATSALAASSLTLTGVAGPQPTFGVATQGSSQPHTNIQPYLAVNFIICTIGIFPSRN